jgi:hypothetical protein
MCHRSSVITGIHEPTTGATSGRDFGGDRKNGIMDRATFTITDAAHHAEGWDYVTTGGQRLHAQMDLTRVP